MAANQGLLSSLKEKKPTWPSLSMPRKPKLVPTPNVSSPNVLPARVPCSHSTSSGVLKVPAG